MVLPAKGFDIGDLCSGESDTDDLLFNFKVGILIFVFMDVELKMNECLMAQIFNIG